MDYLEINTENLVLKPLGKKYLNSTIQYAMDYENTKYMCHLPDETVGEAEEFLANVENEWKKEQPKFLEFAIIYNDIHIGAVSVYFENDAGELGMSRTGERGGRRNKSASEDSLEYQYEFIGR